jgi:hypothetical protein
MFEKTIEAFSTANSRSYNQVNPHLRAEVPANKINFSLQSS